MRTVISTIKNQVIGLFGILLTLGISSCTKNYDDYGPKGDTGYVEIPEATSVIVINEGNFMFGNGSISLVDLESESSAQEVFKNVNGFPLGDVPQSMLISDSLGYIVVNNSGKMEVVTMPDFTSISTITGFTSPRQMEIVSTQPQVAWVTDLYANKIWEVNLETQQITGAIPSTGWNENIEKWKSLVLVLNKKDSVINMFDIPTKSQIKSYQLPSGIVDFRFTSFSELMVLAKNGLYRIDLLVDATYLEYEFQTERNPLKMAYDSINQATYFLDGDLFRYQDGRLNKMLTVQKGSNFYGLEVNNQKVYITDTKDYVQPGELKQFSYNFQDSNVYSMGVNPQYILFP